MRPVPYPDASACLPRFTRFLASARAIATTKTYHRPTDHHRADPSSRHCRGYPRGEGRPPARHFEGNWQGRGARGSSAHWLTTFYRRDEVPAASESTRNAVSCASPARDSRRGAPWLRLRLSFRFQTGTTGPPRLPRSSRSPKLRRGRADRGLRICPRKDAHA